MNVEPGSESLLVWAYYSLGFLFTVLLPLTGLLSFVLAIVIVRRGKGLMAAASLLLIVHLPFLVGVFAAIQGAVSMYAMLGNSSLTPKPNEISQGISTIFVAPLIAMLLMIPGYSVAAIGTLIRSFEERTPEIG